MSLDKVVPVEQLSRFRGGILCHGCFDLLHIGHLRYFRQARMLANDCPLVVTLTGDKHFPTFKGEGRPAFDEITRAEWIAYVGIVDAVAIVRDSPYADSALYALRPRFYVKGRQAEGMIPHEQAVAESIGCRVVFLPADNEFNVQEYGSGRILSGEYMREKIKKCATT